MTPNQSLETIVISDSDSSSSIEVIPNKSVAALHAHVEPPRPVPKSGSVGSPDSDLLVIESTDSDDYGEIQARLKRVDFGGPSRSVDSTVYSSSKTTASNSASRLGYSRPSKPKPRSTSSSSEEDIKKPPLSETLRKRGSRLKQQDLPKEMSNSRAKKAKENDRLETPKAEMQEKATLSKTQSKAQNDINKLVTDKKQTLKDFTIEISDALQDKLFVPLLSSQLDAYGGKTNFFEPPPEVESFIRFRRAHIARYDVVLKIWVPVDPYEKLEDLYIIFLPADSLVLAISEDTLGDMIGALRRLPELTIRSQIFLMVDGLNAYYKRKGGKRPKKSDIEAAMASLQAIAKCFIVHVDGPEDTAQWLFNITGDLGIKPHKRIKESFLPFCTDTQVKCGSTKADTYKKMLRQVRGVTESAADGIINEASTLRELFEGYAQEDDTNLRYNRLKDATVANRKDGAAKSRALNQALSKKVHDVFWGEDPLTLVT